MRIRNNWKEIKTSFIKLTKNSSLTINDFDFNYISLLLYLIIYNVKYFFEIHQQSTKPYLKYQKLSQFSLSFFRIVITTNLD